LQGSIEEGMETGAETSSVFVFLFPSTRRQRIEPAGRSSRDGTFLEFSYGVTVLLAPSRKSSGSSPLGWSQQKECFGRVGNLFPVLIMSDPCPRCDAVEEILYRIDRASRSEYDAQYSKVSVPLFRELVEALLEKDKKPPNA
jgi:hypothetical protein